MEIKNADWYGLLQDTNWTPKYVTEEELFPPQLSDPYGIPVSEWETFDEPYKVTYRDYVKTQREKDVGAYSVKAAVSRVDFYKQSDPGWKAVLQMHFGAVPFLEYGSVSAFARITRFGKGPGMRNMASFGTLDEIRHTQIQMFFAYEFLSVDRAFDWC